MTWCARRATAIRPGQKLGFVLAPAEVARLLLRVIVIQKQHLPAGVKGPCWEWRGPTDPQGYGSIKLRGRRYFVHRVAYSWGRNDEAIEDMQVDHARLNRRCLNPDHLVVKSHGQNAAEANERRWEAYRAARDAQRVDDFGTRGGGQPTSLDDPPF